MKQLLKIGLLLVMFSVPIISATVVVSAMEIPENPSEFGSAVYENVTGNGTKASISIPVQGFIVSDTSQKPGTPHKPEQSGYTRQSAGSPKTGDDYQVEEYLILMLASLLLLFGTAYKKTKSPENTLC